MKIVENCVIFVIIWDTQFSWYLKVITRISDIIFIHFCLRLCWNFLSPNRPYRPSLSHVTDRPSFGGGSTVVQLKKRLPNPAFRVIWMFFSIKKDWCAVWAQFYYRCKALILADLLLMNPRYLWVKNKSCCPPWKTSILGQRRQY